MGRAPSCCAPGIPAVSSGCRGCRQQPAHHGLLRRRDNCARQLPSARTEPDGRRRCQCRLDPRRAAATSGRTRAPPTARGAAQHTVWKGLVAHDHQALSQLAACSARVPCGARPSGAAVDAVGGGRPLDGRSRIRRERCALSCFLLPLGVMNECDADSAELSSTFRRSVLPAPCRVQGLARHHVQ
eukprot:scaffold555_cov109-Isochrysis_galbana.AAC.5